MTGILTYALGARRDGPLRNVSNVQQDGHSM